MNMTFDTIIIGGGPAGYEAAAIGAARGENVLLVERDALGGTCLNRGCIPTKCFCRSAQIAIDVADAAAFGIELPGGNAMSVSMSPAARAIFFAEVSPTPGMDIAKTTRSNGTSRLAAMPSISLDALLSAIPGRPRSMSADRE